MRIKKTISPTKAAILVCASIATVVLLIPQTEAFSVNFVYQDLLAHPQYDVEFLKEVVPASSVARPNTHRRQPRQGQAQIETAKSGTQDQEQQQETIHESPSTMVMTDADGMRWSCMIPPKLVHEVKAPPQLTPQEIKEEERRSVQRGLELLDHLSHHCLLMRRDFWTYEYCHKRSIRQYHAVQSNGQLVPQAPENTYILAVYQPEENNNNQVQPNSEAALQQRSPSSASIVQSTVSTTELEVSHDRKYLVQRWENGDICEETNQRRKVEVQFQCAPFDDRIQLVTESPICNYIMVIYSPNLCKDTAFENVPAPEANKIECKGIVSDEQYQKLKANVPETIDGGAGIVQDRNAQTKIGQVPRQQPHQHLMQQVNAGKAAAATGDTQASVLTIIEDLLVFAQQGNDVDAQRRMENAMAQYAAIAESLKAAMTPKDRAAYERIELLLKGNGDELSKEEREEATKEYRAAMDMIFGVGEEAEKESQQANEPSTPPQYQEQKTFNIHTKEGGAKVPKEREDFYKLVVEAIVENDKKQKTNDGQEATTAKQQDDNINFAKIDSSELLEIMDMLEMFGSTGRAGTAATAAEETQKQGEDKAKEETKEEKKNVHAKL